MHLRLAALILLSTSFLFGADLKITERSGLRDKSLPGTITRWYSGARSRVEWTFEPQLSLADSLVRPAQSRTANIYQCDEHRMLYVDLDSKEYMARALDEHGYFVTPTARKTNEQHIGGALTITVESRDTGERKQMLGHIARHVITTVKLEPSPGSCAKPRDDVTDGWYADLGVSPTGCVKDAESPSTAMAILVANSCQDKVVLNRIGTTESGFPLQATTTSHTQFDDRGRIHHLTFTNKTAVTELSETPLDPSLFEAPAGAKEVSHFTPPPTPLGARLLDGWDHFVHAVSSAFK